LSYAQQNKLTVDPGSRITVKRGAAGVTQTLNVNVLPGFHVNSNQPKDEFLIPLKLTWQAGPLEAGAITYPKSEDIKVGKDLLAVFTGSFAIQTHFTARDSVASGPAVMTGKLRFQACNNEMCFRPASIDIHLPVQIE
jgi:thiol:disulfide interchange protein DsbD